MIINNNFFVERVLPGSILRKLTDEEMEYYRQPFLEPNSRKPTWRWPNEIPVSGEPADVAEAVTAYNQWLQQSDIPKLMLYADPGALMKAPVVEWAKQNLSNLTSVDIGPGSHFIQEDNPHKIGSELAAWYEKL